MTRRIRPLTATDWARLPAPCSACVWSGASLIEPARSPEHRARRQIPLTWADDVTARWGCCGVMAVDDGQVIGFLTMAPAEMVHRLGAQFSLGAGCSTATSPDVAVVMSTQVVPQWQGKGIGRELVQSAAGLVARRNLRALEAVGTYREGPSCLLPASWLQSVGFAVVRPHPLTPRLRMDLQSTARWKPDLAAAWQRLAALVPQGSSPEPAGFEPIRASLRGTPRSRRAAPTWTWHP